ncbi:unnamed protein product [Didymodactylos carnosus]|uniref:Uncharacterized protein n=2 Tax=Didymodactylos carnosus TaxID=1234261 RepID=A0A8S2DDV8_9BILA|nr:unnamed protein product [Didymodactylos carnosus]CAF3711880.1 unnamed protein product [Didymodactylos carnosus]
MSTSSIHDNNSNNEDDQNTTNVVSKPITVKEPVAKEEQINDADKTDNKEQLTTDENKKVSKWKHVRESLCQLAKTYRAENSMKNFNNEDLFNNIKQKLQAHFQLLEQKQQSISSTFLQLYEESNTFLTFESYERYKLLTIHAYHNETSTNAQSQENLEHSEQHKILSKIKDCNFTELLKYFKHPDLHWPDLSACQCDDLVLTVYIHLVDHCFILNRIEEVLYYKIKICKLLLKCNCLQRVLIEIENGRKLANEHVYYYLYFDLLEATVLYRTRCIANARKLIDNGLNSLNQLHKEVEEKLQKEQEKKRRKFSMQPNQTDTIAFNVLSRKISLSKADQQSLDLDEQTQRFNHQLLPKRSSIVQLLANHESIYNVYSFEYLKCQFYVLQYKIGKRIDNQTLIDESIQTILKYPYYKYPFSFSCSCTILLIDYYYEHYEYQICLNLINQFIKYWWLISGSSEKLEFAKLITLSLIIQLNQNNVGRSIHCGYFSTDVLSRFHENIFLVETLIQLTYSLLYKMGLSSIEKILDNLDDISNQTSNYYTKLWYYILVIDVAVEFGYEILPINLKFLNLLSNYRKKLTDNSKQLFYVDCSLAQIYSRIKEFKLSTKHFNNALTMFSYTKLSMNDFSVQRALFKLAEVQLLNWWYQVKYKHYTDIVSVTKEHFLYTYIKNLLPKESKLLLSRYYIYDAYYSRLVETYQQSLLTSLPTNKQNDTWIMSIQQAKDYAGKYSIKLDCEWINQLNTQWSNKVSETKSITKKKIASSDANAPSMITKYLPRKSIPSENQLNVPQYIDKIMFYNDDVGKQKFIDQRLYNSKNSGQFLLYMLPVIV